MLQINELMILKDGQQLLALEKLSVDPGDIATIMGPSGSGKSTLLRWMLGEPLSDFTCTGELWLDKRRIDGLPIHRRQLGLMYQKGDLFPHMSVAENLNFALPRSLGRQQANTKVAEALEDVGLSGKLGAMPEQLSGGEQSRIALLRSLLAEPKAILLDEPFSALDTEMRQSIRSWTFAQLAQRQIPAVLVTHDPEDICSDGPVVNLGGEKRDD
ncbi:MAG: ATP-binding cassette domain-containing protein [Pseudomonadota bacterium]